MFLLIYIYLLIIAGMGGYAILENVTWIDFLTAVGMSTLLYVDLIIMGRYLLVFIEKINKKKNPSLSKFIFFFFPSLFWYSSTPSTYRYMRKLTFALIPA